MRQEQHPAPLNRAQDPTVCEGGEGKEYRQSLWRSSRRPRDRSAPRISASVLQHMRQTNKTCKQQTQTQTVNPPQGHCKPCATPCGDRRRGRSRLCAAPNAKGREEMNDDEVVLGLAQPRTPRRAGLRRRRAEALVHRAQDPMVYGCSPDPSCKQRNPPCMEEHRRQVRRDADPQ